MVAKSTKVKGLPAVQSLELEKLTQVIGLHLGIGGIFIVAVGNKKIQQRIERSLKTYLEDGIAWHPFTVDNERTDVFLYLKGLVNKQDIEPAKTIISIKALEDYHPDIVQKILHALNTRREYVYQDKLLCLFWVRPELMAQLQHQAKDFWSFRSYTCKFEEMPSHWRIPAKRPESYHNRIQEITSLIKRVKDSTPLNRGLLASLYFALGEQASKYSDLERALSSFLKAKELLVQTQDKRNLASTIGNIGLIYKGKGDLDEALRYLEQALKIFREMGSKGGVKTAAENIKQIKETVQSKARQGAG